MFSLRYAQSTRTGPFWLPDHRQRNGKEIRMHRFGFLFSVRFWVPVWLGFLFVGLLPLPPVAELVITIGALSHGAWYLCQRSVDAERRRPRKLRDGGHEI